MPEPIDRAVLLAARIAQFGQAGAYATTQLADIYDRLLAAKHAPKVPAWLTWERVQEARGAGHDAYRQAYNKFGSQEADRAYGFAEFRVLLTAALEAMKDRSGRVAFMNATSDGIDARFVLDDLLAQIMGD